MKRGLLLLAFALAAWAQDTGKFYRLDFVVKEFDDNKLVSAKTYSTFMSTDDRSRGAQIRTGNRVPYSVGPNQFQYADVGVNIDCQKLSEVGGQLVAMVQADVSSIPSGEAPPGSSPLIRQNRWNGTVVIPPAKATTLFSSDDLNAKRKMQLELTATPVK
ncbi:MAG: hypothetical protein K2X03_07280 [Bryobacteraceae bacterium]|nr:hypothetical protein [Bryobacteraceae bacterium]